MKEAVIKLNCESGVNKNITDIWVKVDCQNGGMRKQNIRLFCQCAVKYLGDYSKKYVYIPNFNIGEQSRRIILHKQLNACNRWGQCYEIYQNSS